MIGIIEHRPLGSLGETGSSGAALLNALLDGYKSLEYWTPIFVDRRNTGHLTAAQVSSYSALLESVNKLRSILLIKVDASPDLQAAIAQATGISWDKVRSTIENANSYLNYLLAGSPSGVGGLGGLILLAPVIGQAIGYLLAIAVASFVVYELAQVVTSGDMAEVAKFEANKKANELIMAGKTPIAPPTDELLGGVTTFLKSLLTVGLFGGGAYVLVRYGLPLLKGGQPRAKETV